MVNYAEEEDFGHRPRRRANPTEVARRRAERAARRTRSEWLRYARDVVYRQLAARDRSEKELRDSMAKNLVPEDIIDDTLTKFREAGLVDDSKFAATFVAQKFASKATSRRALAQDLSNKGITGEKAQVALEQIDDEAEYQAALKCAQKKMGSMREVEPEIAKRRLYGALGRRGFAMNHISRAIHAVMSELD